MSYSINVYRGQAKPTKNYLAFLAYVSFLPQLVAGPIEQAFRLLPQFLNHTRFTPDGFRFGLHQIIIGFFKKLVLADNIAPYVNSVYAYISSASPTDFTIETIGFGLQIFLDFSAYSHIARGTAVILGLECFRIHQEQVEIGLCVEQPYHILVTRHIIGSSLDWLASMKADNVIPFNGKVLSPGRINLRLLRGSLSGANSADKAAWERTRAPSCASWLKRTYPGDSAKYVSHETIYRSLHVQARGVLKKELMAHLRASRRTIRRSRHTSLKRDGLGQITEVVSIRERPAEDRAVPGHWEGDFIAGSKQSFIATLVERHSRYVTLVKIAGKETAQGALQIPDMGQRV